MTFGGGMAMLPILQREVVENKGWATDEELVDYFAIGQCTPGIIAVNTAKKNKIPYQLEIMTDGGTDAGAIHLTRAGIKTGGISVPTRYVHSPSEMASVSDIENSVKLLYNIAIAQW